MYIKLTDGTVIQNCAEGTTTDNIIHTGETYQDAISILDTVNADNTSSIRVFNDDDTEVAFCGNLVLNSGATVGETEDYKFCIITLRHKTESEIMKDEIAELQEAIIGE